MPLRPHVSSHLQWTTLTSNSLTAPTVWIEARHDVNVGPADNVPNSLVGLEVLQEIGRQGDHHLPSHGLIPVHVGNKLHHRLQSDTFTLGRKEEL